MIGWFIEVKLRHVQADHTPLEHPVAENAFFSQNEDRKAQLVRHSRFNVSPRCREPCVV